MLYGDIACIMGQNFIIVVLMWAWGTGKGPIGGGHVASVLVSLAAVMYAFFYLGAQEGGAAMLLTYSTLITIMSKLPQVHTHTLTLTHTHSHSRMRPLTPLLPLSLTL